MALIKTKHFAGREIKDKTDELSVNWNELLKQLDDRKRRLDISLEQQKVCSNHLLPSSTVIK